MAAMLDQVCLDGPLWFVRVMMGVNTMINPTENEMVGRKTLRLRLSDGTEVLIKQSLGGNALHLAAHCICVLCIAASYAVFPLPPAVSSTEGRQKNCVGLGRPLRVKDALILGQDQGS